MAINHVRLAGASDTATPQPIGASHPQQRLLHGMEVGGGGGAWAGGSVPGGLEALGSRGCQLRPHSRLERSSLLLSFYVNHRRLNPHRHK